MPSSVGTRSVSQTRKEHVDAGQETRSHTRDKGMSKNVTNTMTFSTGGTITGSNGDFSAFVVGDTVLVNGTNLNNGYHNVTGIDGTNHAFLTVDPAPKNETVSATVRAA